MYWACSNSRLPCEKESVTLLAGGAAQPLAAFALGGSVATPAAGIEAEVIEVKSLEEAQSIKGNLESKAVTVTAHAGTGGRLFGAVSTADIAAAVKAAGGPELDKRTIEVPTPIKTTGTHSALVRLHPEVQATVELDVVAG